MFDKLPELIDPIYSVNHNKHFVGRVNQARLKRLADMVLSADREVEVQLDFYYDRALRFPAFVMKLKTNLNLQCQRSLKPFDYAVETEVKGIFTESMALIDDLPADIEVYDLEGGKVSPLGWIEDELLLCVPIAPIDEQNSMDYENDSIPDVVAKETVLQEEAFKKPNPFAVLQGLKK
ncbi:YceD family protein [Thiomicrorhabdus aquaedulcis]|uniref:YceD family protein n=1 Tax=Thiomicrorhabdus aquaedulcis TaxID=2211106 RepID=UPI001562A5D0|nr:YceD family protein [Thiomicrorhabdus aquaedulcis]